MVNQSWNIPEAVLEVLEKLLGSERGKFEAKIFKAVILFMEDTLL